MSKKSLNELIGERAYHVYLERERTGAPGDSASDWAQAEKEITAELKKTEAVKPAEVPAKKAGGRKKAAVPAVAPEAPVKERKKPGRKPQSALEAAAAPVKERKKPGRKPRAVLEAAAALVAAAASAAPAVPVALAAPDATVKRRSPGRKAEPSKKAEPAKKKAPGKK